MERKSKLGKVTCCDRVLGWLAEGLAVFCPRCGKQIYPEMRPEVYWTGQEMAAEVRRRREGGANR